ncbi:DUF2254 family protein [Plantactinospora sp. WMMC1484]|uniref:DUF2254 domain-containing protein n=1 Tax=Plantactinospora sp. WMMC1484 TaxID=3404122 RepID=UPI003BF5BA6F
MLPPQTARASTPVRAADTCYLRWSDLRAAPESPRLRTVRGPGGTGRVEPADRSGGSSRTPPPAPTPCRRRQTSTTARDRSAAPCGVAFAGQVPGNRPPVIPIPGRGRRAAGAPFWLLPGLFAVCSVCLGVGLSFLEQRVGIPVKDFLPSAPAGARSLLSSIISAMISFTALVFSITVVALQLASSQYSPRVLRAFLEDRGIQTSLGTFIATFLFATVVLVTLPDRPDQRLPELSLAVSILLLLLSTAVFIYYLHHITTIMRVSHLIGAIGRQTRHSIARHHHWPEADPGTPEHLGAPIRTICTRAPGVVMDVDLAALAVMAERHHCAFTVLPLPGDFLPAGAGLLTVHRLPGKPPREVRASAVRRTFAIGAERTSGRDIGFGFRQLADIATRALSPSSNDVTTAVNAVRESHDLLRRLAEQPVPPFFVAVRHGVSRVYAPRQGFEDFVSVAVDEVLQTGREHPRITRLLAAVLRDLAAIAAPQHRPMLESRLERLGIDGVVRGVGRQHGEG